MRARRAGVLLSRQTVITGSEDIDNPHRLSFGKELEIYEHKENAQSPTFKMI